MAEIRVKEVDKHKYAVYLDKAREFYEETKHAETEEKWNAACLNAIHCAISSSDALSTFFLGKRSSGQRHEDAAWLIQQCGLPDSHDKAKQFLEIIRLKNLVEYDDEEPTEKESRRLILQAERFYQWARQQLPQ